MLPGFRILFATTILAISILVFGLGAAALLRAAHEEFASLPSWRLAQQPPLTPQVPRPEITPVLAMLRIEAPGTKPLPETLPREVALPQLAPQQPAASQFMPVEAQDTKPAETATPDNGSAVKEADEATASAPVTGQVASLNAQVTIDAPAKPDAPVEEANGPDVNTPDIKVSGSKILEPAQPAFAELKSSELKSSELKSAELKSSDLKPSPSKAPVTEASEPLSTVASIERSTEATAFATEPKPVVKKARRPSARAIAQRREAARALAEERAKAEQLRRQQSAFPLFGG
ncbi:hypothetical protein HNQ36_004716 [Afipia massiliensis]|uniref:Uncharacterized protein n=1 Tax=Afipia massiliensis TaxID=211460 RepID=A0A840N2L8_9BRAD|nr:hypothetical protein [Afipia massiliensis]MBB5054709.1 hypothetical protein [Afipia massiliensis]